MDTVVTNGIVVTATETYEADIGIKGGKIAALGRGLQGAETIDAQGNYVMPGGIDIHTHFELPFMGTVAADDFETGSIAAACGGTTTFIDFAIQGKGESLHQALETWMERVRGKAAVDYGFHVAIGDMTDEVMNVEMAEMVEQGITSFKLFMAYKGTFMVDDETLFKALIKARELGALIMVHAENGDVLNYLISKHVAEGKKEPIWHALSHPPEAEAEAAGRAIILAGLAGAPIYIVHLSAAEALEKVRRRIAMGTISRVVYLFANLKNVAVLASLMVESNFENAVNKAEVIGMEITLIKATKLLAAFQFPMSTVVVKNASMKL